MLAPHIHSLRFCTQEIVIMREDLVNKMRRNCLLPPTEDGLETPISAHVRERERERENEEEEEEIPGKTV